jgi:hypothetical protein
MKKRSKAVFGIYKTRNEVDIAVSILRNDGFRTEDISVLLPQLIGAQNFFHRKGSKAPEGAAAGGGTGLILGGLVGLLLGAGSLTIPGLGALIAAGPLLSTMAGIGFGGTVGALAGALVGYGIPEYEAKRYEGFVKKGGILLSVHADDELWIEKAKMTLELSGATDVSVSSQLTSTWGPKKLKNIDDTLNKYF